MARRKSIYISSKTELILGAAHKNISGRINGIAMCYELMMAERCPAFTQVEWMHIYNVNVEILTRGTDPGGVMDPIRFIWANVLNNPVKKNTGEVDQKELSERLRAMPYLVLVSIGEVVIKVSGFLKVCEISEERLPYSEMDMLLLCGAKISPAGIEA